MGPVIPPALEALLDAHDGVATAPELRALVADRVALLRTGLVRRGPRGLFLSDHHATPRTAVRLAVLRSSSAVASHSTAAALHGIDGSTEVLPPPHVIVPHGRRAPGCIVHQRGDLLAREVGSVAGIPCTDVTRTICDLAATSPAAVERALEWALRCDRTTEQRLLDTAVRMLRPGRNGARLLRDLIGRRPAGTPPTESDAETVFLQVVRRADRPDPLRQVPVIIDGRVVHRIDFVYDWPGLFAPVWVEIDGIATHEGWAALTRDLHRQNLLMRSRPVLLRFTSVDVYRRPAYVRQEVWHHLGLAWIRTTAVPTCARRRA